VTRPAGRHLLALLLTPVLLAGCAVSGSAAQQAGPAAELRLGYFDTVTHAPALVGRDQGLLQDALGDTTLTMQVLGAGPAAIEALSAGAIDAAYLGPNPTVNSFVQSAGRSVRIVAGAANGGAALVVRAGITEPGDLAGTTIATPQLGNTQDVALRSWLGDQGYTTSTMGGGDVDIVPTDSAQAFALFESGAIDGAWLPEPWVSRFVLEADAQVLVDEASLWPDGAFPTTVLAVSSDYLAAHPDTVAALVAGHTASVDWLGENPDQAAAAINRILVADTGTPLPQAVLDRALTNVSFTTDPLAATFPVLLEAGVTAGTTKSGSLTGLFDLGPLNRVRAAAGAGPVPAAGLGTE
jgi:NitT/TauT family transport system substrate-binding protein